MDVFRRVQLLYEGVEKDGDRETECLAADLRHILTVLAYWLFTNQEWHDYKAENGL